MIHSFWPIFLFVSREGKELCLAFLFNTPEYVEQLTKETPATTFSICNNSVSIFGAFQ